MDNRVKLIGGAVLGLFAIIALSSVAGSIFETNNAGYYQVKQAAMTGELTVVNTPGTYMQNFATITTYQISDVHYFSKNDIEGGQEVSSDPIKVRFNDGGTAECTGSIKFRLPADPAKQLLLHNDFKSFDRVKHDLIRQVVAEAMMQTATLMKAEESYSTRRSEFAALVEAQIENGIYETESREFKEKDADGNEFIEREVNLKLVNGKPVVRKESPLNRYGIEVIQFITKDIDFDQTIDALIAKKKEAEQQKVVARANAEKAKQDAITAREQGNAKIAEEKAKQEVEKIKEVTIAQKEYEVSKLKRQQAEQDAAAQVTQGKALAEVNRLKVAAGLTPLEKATIAKETAIGVAEQLSKVQFPGMMIIGGGNGNSSPMNPFDAVGLESFHRLSEKLSRGGKSSKEE
jgi:regulator of protease activity HflC (stomatin/prohibitin superfamily)